SSAVHVITNRPAVAPVGGPIATAPPLTLVRARSFWARAGSPSARTRVVTSGTAADASLISMTSMSARVSPALADAWGGGTAGDRRHRGDVLRMPGGGAEPTQVRERRALPLSAEHEGGGTGAEVGRVAGGHGRAAVDRTESGESIQCGRWSGRFVVVEVHRA